MLAEPTEPAHPLAVANALDAASEDMQEELASDRIFSDKERVGLPPGELVDLLQEGIEEGTFCAQSNPEPPSCPIAYRPCRLPGRWLPRSV